MIYLDNAATTAVSRPVLDAMLPYFTQTFGNPNSVHEAGSQADWAVTQARARMAKALNCAPRQVEFTSGGTESDNQALLTGAVRGAQAGKRHIVSSAIEHPAVLRMLERLQAHGFAVTLGVAQCGGRCVRGKPGSGHPAGYVPGQLDVGEQRGRQRAARRGSGAFVPRTRHPVPYGCGTGGGRAAAGLPGAGCGPDRAFPRTSSTARRASVRWWCATAWSRHRCWWAANRRRGHRAGTLNVPGIVGMSVALQQAQERCAQNAARMRGLRTRLIDGLAALGDVCVLGSNDSQRVAPGIVCACFKDLDRETLLVLLDQAGICASAGSACSAGAVEPSHVLQAMRVPREWARGAIRFSLGTGNTEQEIDETLAELERIVSRLRERRAR